MKTYQHVKQIIILWSCPRYRTQHLTTVHLECFLFQPWVSSVTNQRRSERQKVFLINCTSDSVLVSFAGTFDYLIHTEMFGLSDALKTSSYSWGIWSELSILFHSTPPDFLHFRPQLQSDTDKWHDLRLFQPIRFHTHQLAQPQMKSHKQTSQMNFMYAV